MGKFDGLDKRIGLLEASHKEILEKQDGLDKRLRSLEASTDESQEDMGGLSKPPVAGKEQGKKGVKRAGVGDGENKRMTRAKTIASL